MLTVVVAMAFAGDVFCCSVSWFILLVPFHLPIPQILNEWFGRSVIRSCVKLSYDHAQSMIEAPEKMFSAEELPPVDPEHPIDEIHQAVLNLHSIAKNLRAQRFSGGALRLDQVSPCYLCLSFLYHAQRSMTEMSERGDRAPKPFTQLSEQAFIKFGKLIWYLVDLKGLKGLAKTLLV